jgi:hypothetical protein
MPERFQDELESLLIEEIEDYEVYKLIKLLCAGTGIGKGILETGEVHAFVIFTSFILLLV